MKNSQLSEDRILSQLEENLPFRYTGASMYPTFRSGQLLYTRPKSENLKVGDVIVFFDPIIKTTIVHRVVDIVGDQIYTKGDNNPEMDAHPISPDLVRGVIAWVGKEGSLLPVRGGRASLMRIRLFGLWQKVRSVLAPCLSPLYKILKASGLPRLFWHPKIHQVKLQAGQGLIIKYIHRNKTVAVWDKRFQRFTCHHPYDLVIQKPKTGQQASFQTSDRK